MVIRHGGSEWPSVETDAYKNEPGTWVDVTRRVLFDRDSSQFQVRYFELGPEGYTSFEKHVHEHCVVVLRGEGEVQLGDRVERIGPMDVVAVTSETPHQFRNTGTEPFGILCIVDRERDRPVLLGNPPDSAASS